MMTDKTHPILSILKQDPVSDGVQRLVHMHCERKNTAAMLDAVAKALLSRGMTDRSIPHNVGIRTADLMSIAEESIRRTVDTYHEAGGVLTAKGHVPKMVLAAAIAKIWVDTWSAPLAETFKIGGAKHDEVVERLTVSAQVMLNKMLEKGTVVDDTMHLKMCDIETICRSGALAMFNAFNNPNDTNHENVHGKKPR